MANSIGEAFVTVRADTGGFEGDLKGTVARIGAALGGLALGKATFDFFKVGIQQAGELERVAAQTNAVIKSTGGVANVSAKEVRALGDAMEKKTGIDQVQIETGANMLLTFRSVRNEVGKGNDIFDQAVKVSTDLSVAFGQDLQGSAVMVGKALEDPIRGMTALRRVGVQFTEDQEKTIKKLVETGDLMGAQKLILKELETQVGGSAAAYGETLPGKMAIAKQAFEDMQISMAAGLLPAIEFGTSAVQFLSEKVSELPGPLAGATAAVVGFGGAALFMAPQINAAVQVAQTLGPKVLEAGAGVAKMAGNFALGAVSAGQLGTGLSAAAGAVLGVGALMVGAGLGVAYLAGAFDTSGVSASQFGQNLAKMPLAKAVPEFINLGSAIQKAGESTVMANGPLLQGTLTLDVFKETAKASFPAAMAMRDAIVAYGKAGEDGLPTQKEMNRVLSESRQSFAESAGAADASKTVIDSYAQTIIAAKSTIDNIKVATDEWNTKLAANLIPSLQATDATIQYEQALDQLTEAFMLDTTGMDLNEASGRAVASMLETVIATSSQTAEKQIALAVAHDDLTSAQDIARFSAQDLVNDLLATGAAAGESQQDVIAYTADVLNIPADAYTMITNSADPAAALVNYLIGTIYNIPTSHNTDITTTNAQTAIGTLLGVADAANAIPSVRSVFINAFTNISSGMARLLGLAEHGMVAMAGGGYVTRGPQMALIGEAGPEAVVPLGNTHTNKRDRARVMQAAGLGPVGVMGSDLSRVEYLLGQIVANQMSTPARKPSASIIGSRR